MNKRDEKDIWANMYDLPMEETLGPIAIDEIKNLPIVNKFFNSEIEILKILPIKKHILTHQRLFVQLIIVVNQPVKLKEGWFFTPIENLKKLAMPKIIFIFIKNIFNL